jgi:hypothetical protein
MLDFIHLYSVLSATFLSLIIYPENGMFVLHDAYVPLMQLLLFQSF